MKDFIEFTFIWATHIIWMFILFVITTIGIGVLKELDFNYENSVCCMYGYILGLVCSKVSNRGSK